VGFTLTSLQYSFNSLQFIAALFQVCHMYKIILILIYLAIKDKINNKFKPICP